MISKTVSALAGIALAASVGMTQAEPLKLDAAQLDDVTAAGWTFNFGSGWYNLTEQKAEQEAEVEQENENSQIGVAGDDSEVWQGQEVEQENDSDIDQEVEQEVENENEFFFGFPFLIGPIGP